MQTTHVKKSLCLFVCSLIALPICAGAAPENYKWKTCFADFDGKAFTLGNGLYKRSWKLGDGQIIPAAKDSPQAADSSSWSWSIAYGNGRDFPVGSEAMIAELTATKGQEKAQYRFRVFDQIPAIEWSRSAPVGTEIPVDTLIDSLEIATPADWEFTAVRLRDRTDGSGINSLAKAVPHPLEKGAFTESVNIGFIENKASREGVVFIKLAPLPDARPQAIKCDFSWDGKTLSWFGPGVNVISGHGYPCATIPYKDGRAGRIAAMQDFSRSLRGYKPGRDGVLLSNTWGDRSADSKISEPFLIQEIKAGKALGVDVMEVDDGWQKGASKNSSSVGKGKEGKWSGFWKSDPEFWTPNPERLPKGLSPLAEAAKDSGLHLGLWYGPDSEDEFANWERDADHLLKMHREHGVDYFKLDSIEMKTQKAEWNVKQLLNKLTKDSDGKIVTDLDVTAGARPGYLGAVEAGAVFVENRYSDWGTYWPHLTLRNFWCLAEYVDPVRLRMEFLNNARSVDIKKYKDNPLAPANYPPAYLFASIMFGSPLAWFEVSNLPPAYANEVAPLVKIWKEHREAIQDGHIIPIGNQPDGHQWTGFASIAKDKKSAYVVVLRELNDADQWDTTLPLVGAVDGETQVLSGEGTATCAKGTLTVSIPESLRYLFLKINLH